MTAPKPQTTRSSRAARVLKQAEDVFGGRTPARNWLRKPNRALGGRKPADLLKTSEGAADVLAVLGRIEHGVYS